MYELNDNKAAITAIQNLLRDAGYDIKPDGIYGTETADAVRMLQAEKGLVPTGRVDLMTFELLVTASRPVPVYECALIIPSTLAGNVITPGEVSSVVVIIQAMLKVLEVIYDFESIDVTGVYDDVTEAAITELQRINGLPVTGIIDALTWNALVSEYEKYKDWDT